MLDGLYQSLMCFFLGYLLFSPATVVTSNGLNVNDRDRLGVYIACATIVVVNVYVLLNTYRWDWLMLLLVILTISLIWFWTGVYTAFVSSASFYKAAPQVFGQLSFWALTLLIVFVCLLPRFTAKYFQKVFLPRDVDIIREQIRQGKFKYLDNFEAYVSPAPAPANVSSAASSDLSKTPKPGPLRSPTSRGGGGGGDDDDDRRPIYPPSLAQTATTTNVPLSQNGSDGTDYRRSLEHPVRPSFDRPRPSFDRMRQSMDRIRPSFEQSNDFTSAAMLTRVESSHSQTQSQNRRNPHGSSSLR